ncbi:MAG: DUF6531 domain-containing protein, partial [Clostridiales bacterium]|nr:DUF6531 domain-containing protein [Clostridiales bacterium]
MEFELNIPTLERVVKHIDKGISNMKALQRSFSGANRDLVSSGWKGLSSEAFAANNEQGAADFTTYVNNLTNIKDILSKVLRLAEDLNKQALGFAGIFGGGVSGTKGLLSLSRPAKAEVCRNCRQAIDSYDSYITDLQALKDLNTRLGYSRLSLGNDINSAIREIESNKAKLSKLVNALEAYEKGLDELERIMKSWEAGVTKPTGWGKFTEEFLVMLGDLGAKGISAFTEAKSYDALLASLLGLNLNCCQYGGDPVNMATGNFVHEKEFLKTKGLFSMSFKIFYNAQGQKRNILGLGWAHNFEVSISKGEDQAVLLLEQGKQEIFIKGRTGAYYQSQGLDHSLSEKDSQFIYRNHEGLKYYFEVGGKLLRKEDRNGNYIDLSYDEDGRLAKTANNSGGIFAFHYEEG